MSKKANASGNADKPAKPKVARKAKQHASEVSAQTHGNEGAAAYSQSALNEAKNSLNKLPIMGLALWLFCPTRNRATRSSCASGKVHPNKCQD